MSTKSETCDARRAHIALVIHMAKAGDNPSAAKSEWVRTVSERLSIEPKDVAEAESMTLEEIRPILSHSIGDRAVIIRDAMLCGTLDGHIDEAKYKCLDQIASLLGLPNAALEKIQKIGMSCAPFAYRDGIPTTTEDIHAIRLEFGVRDEIEIDVDQQLILVCKKISLSVNGLWKLMPRDETYTDDWWLDLWVFGGWVDVKDPIERMGLIQANNDPDLIADVRTLVILNLIGRGADVAATDANGKSAIDHARGNTLIQSEAIKALEAALDRGSL